MPIESRRLRIVVPRSKNLRSGLAFVWFGSRDLRLGLTFTENESSVNLRSGLTFTEDGSSQARVRVSFYRKRVFRNLRLGLTFTENGSSVDLKLWPTFT